MSEHISLSVCSKMLHHFLKRLQTPAAPLLVHSEVLVFTSQPSRHSPRHTRRWWIRIRRTQISVSLKETRRFALDWHDLATPQGCRSSGDNCVWYPLTPPPPAEHLVTDYAHTLLNICFSLTVSSWVKVWEWSHPPPRHSLRFSVTAPVK